MVTILNIQKYRNKLNNWCSLKAPTSGLTKRDTMSELEDIGNSIGNSIKDMVGLETNKDIIDDIKDIDVGHIDFGETIKSFINNSFF